MRLTAGWYVMSVIELETATATLTWAVPARRANWAVNAVQAKPRPPADWVMLADL
jgi:hypothetical protein